MGRLILLVLVIVAVVLIWKAFGPGSWNGGTRRVKPAEPKPEIKGPDDDEEFLWTLEKNRFKARRAREEAERQEAERMRRAHERYDAAPGAESPHETTSGSTHSPGDSGPGGSPGTDGRADGSGEGPEEDTPGK